MTRAGSRLVATVVLALCVSTVGSAGAATSDRHARAHLTSVQQLVFLDRATVARAAPDPEARAVGKVAALTPLSRSQAVLPVIASRRGPAGGQWLHVRLPMRPNSATGWIPAATGTLGETGWRIVVHRAERRALVLQDGRARASFAVIVGKRSTPTPLGSFFVVEKLHLARGVAEGPWALAISAHSDVFNEFAGGDGQVALHGTVGFDDPLGTFSSHGCVRFGVDAITWIAAHVGAGTPVTIAR